MRFGSRAVAIDLNELLRVMIDLYEPSMSEKGLKVKLHSRGPVEIFADAALLHRMVANLLDNELKHLPPDCTLTIELRAEDDTASLILEDDGPGFDSEVLPHLFERRVKGRDSNGHGLGLAFVDAVARAHGGTVTASNRESGGAHIAISSRWPPSKFSLPFRRSPVRTGFGGGAVTNQAIARDLLAALCSCRAWRQWQSTSIAPTQQIPNGPAMRVFIWSGRPRLLPGLRCSKSRLFSPRVLFRNSASIWLQFSQAFPMFGFFCALIARGFYRGTLS